ncbi:hypothetical protein BpHYR1_012235 [Brachionus plicatilis]|uniref:Uncharacterized protein n=1 Tax=Brachionus plicatilis TaxID=10195 RepID=A0A3M7PLI9_BRAPC|nr:hypothetical protein BpHYR1_012235 [Brachionus plicatilis]
MLFRQMWQCEILVQKLHEFTKIYVTLSVYYSLMFNYCLRYYISIDPLREQKRQSLYVDFTIAKNYIPQFY